MLAFLACPFKTIFSAVKKLSFLQSNNFSTFKHAKGSLIKNQNGSLIKDPQGSLIKDLKGFLIKDPKFP